MNENGIRDPDDNLEYRGTGPSESEIFRRQHPMPEPRWYAVILWPFRLVAFLWTYWLKPILSGWK